MDLNNLSEFFKGKRLFVIVGVLIFLLFLLVLMSGLSKKSTPTVVIEPSLSVEQTLESDTSSTSDPNRSVELQKAIAEQTKVDQEYAGWEQNIIDNYPWRKKLPLTSEKYYVYFDLNQKVFIGRLYLQAGDDEVQIKADILKQLKEVKEIPIENFKFEWVVNP